MAEKYEKVMKELQAQIDAKLIQGAVIQSNRDDAPICAGIQAGELPMTPDSRFDIASMGKVFTAACCGTLIAQGRIDPDAPFTTYLPEHVLGKNCKITVRDLASHSSGFDNSKPYHNMKPGPFEEKLFQLMPVRERRTLFEYSCANFILLGKIAERITGKDLDALSREIFWGPLGMNSTTWNAPRNGPHEVMHHNPTRAPGEHNDSDCWHYDRPLGSGSCFTTIGDMMKYAKTVLKKEFFAPEVFDLFYTCDFVSNGTRRSFGWDMTDAKRPAQLSAQTIHHSGYTGQTIFVDPETDFCAVIMTSRTGDWTEAINGRIRLAAALF